MKKFVFILIIFTLLLVIPVPGHAAGVTATRVTTRISVDGVETVLDAYAIDDYNYTKLRDIAYILSDTKDWPMLLLQNILPFSAVIKDTQNMNFVLFLIYNIKCNIVFNQQLSDTPFPIRLLLNNAVPWRHPF